MSSNARTKQQKLEETIPSLANHSIGVLWDGIDRGFENQPTPPQELACGAIANADDMRISALSSRLTENECLEKVLPLLDGMEESDELMKRVAGKISSHMASVLRFAKFSSEDGEYNITVHIKSTFVHGKATSVDSHSIALFYTDELCERCRFDVIKLSCDILMKVFSELGFYIQDLGTAGFLSANNAIKNEERSFRLSWFKPSVSEYREKIDDVSQIDAYVAGVPLEDIFA